MTLAMVFRQMRSGLLFFIMGLFMIKAHAHDPREAFFVIEQKGDSVQVRAEFPWSLRNTLLMYEPSLKDASDKPSFETVFFNYVKSTLILRDYNGTVMQLVKIQKMGNAGHSHQSDYMLTFLGSHLAEIQNEFMFNVSDRQVNYHIIRRGDEAIHDRTSSSCPSFRLEQEASYGVRWGLALLVVMSIYMTSKSVVPNIGNGTLSRRT